jgi:hypothetical protein
MAGMLRSLWKIIRNSDSVEQVEPALDEATRVTNEERRAVQRYAGPVPATVSAGLSSFPESATMRDLNEKGLYIYSTVAFPRGATLEVVTELPSELSLYGKRRVHYTASVVRVEENVGEGKYGIAAVIKKCEVLPPRRTPDAAETQPQEPEYGKTSEKKTTSNGPATGGKLHMKDSAQVGD